jgi:hypothetical protein
MQGCRGIYKQTLRREASILTKLLAGIAIANADSPDYNAVGLKSLGVSLQPPSIFQAIEVS